MGLGKVDKDKTEHVDGKRDAERSRMNLFVPATVEANVAAYGLVRRCSKTDVVVRALEEFFERHDIDPYTPPVFMHSGARTPRTPSSSGTPLLRSRTHQTRAHR